MPEEIASLVRDKERKDEQQFADLSRRNIPVAPIKTNADGGMHPVFVEAVKKNQIGVAPQESSFLVSTAPGTIPVTVRPPRIPELADAPAVAGVAPAPAVSGEVAPPAMAIAETKPAAQPAARSSGGSLFGSLFSSKTAEAKPAEPKSDGTARSHGAPGRPGGNDRKPRRQPPRPRRPEAEARRQADEPRLEWRDPRQAGRSPADQDHRSASSGAGRCRRAGSPPPPASTAMNGAAPVVPTGNFDSRWSGFR